MNKETIKAFRRRFGWCFVRVFLFFGIKSCLSCDYFLGNVVGRLFYFFVFRHRRVTLESLCIAFPELTNLQRKKIAKSCFIFMAQSALEMLYFLHNQEKLKDIRIEGKEFLDEALNQKKGVIGLTAHLGNFPLVSFKLAVSGYSVCTMARPMRDEKAGDYIQGLRDRVGVKTILSYPRRKCVADTIKMLKENGTVLIQMDQNFGTGGVWVKFFNSLAATPVGPVVFALRTQAPVLPIYILRDGLGKHVIKILPPLEVETREDKDETILVNTINFTKVIESWVRSNPEQWSWIHKRWKSRPSEKVMAQRFKVQRD